MYSTANEAAAEHHNAAVKKSKEHEHPVDVRVSDQVLQNNIREIFLGTTQHSDHGKRRSLWMCKEDKTRLTQGNEVDKMQEERL